MATVLVANDIVRLRIACMSATQLGMNILHFGVAITAGAPTLEQAATACDVAVAPGYKAAMNSSVFYWGIGISRVKPNPTSEVVATTSRGAGTTGGDLLPAQTSGLIGFYDGARGRAHRGRAYIPFPSESDSDANGSPNVGYIAKMNTIIAMLTAGITFGSGGNTGRLDQNLQHGHGGTATYTLITRWSNPGKWATQRRRGGYGAPNLPPF